MKRLPARAVPSAVLLGAALAVPLAAWMKRLLVRAAALSLLLAAGPPALAEQAGPQPLGRLFNTPQQRALLDARRDGIQVDSQPLPPAPMAEPRPDPLQLSGVVQRSNGKSTIWVNQAPLPDSLGQVLKDRSVSLRLPSGQRITLKPGQSYDEATGTIANAGE